MEQKIQEVPKPNETASEKLFTQEDVNRIVSERLKRHSGQMAGQTSANDAEREKSLTARENKLTCREYIVEKGYPSDLLDALDTSDPEKFKENADKLAKLMPNTAKPTGRKIDIGPNIQKPRYPENDPLREAFKRK